MSGTGTVEWELERGEDILAVTIAYTVADYDPGSTYGPPEDCYPPEGGEVEELTATMADGTIIELTPEELDKVEKHIYATHEYGSHYEEDPDDAYDRARDDY